MLRVYLTFPTPFFLVGDHKIILQITRLGLFVDGVSADNAPKSANGLWNICLRDL